MFEKLVAIEPVSLIPSAEEELHRYAKAGGAVPGRTRQR